MIYVLNSSGEPLMPTENMGYVRKLLFSGKAEIAKHTPFTIRLLKHTEECTPQEVTLGIDTGSKKAAISVIAEDKELYAAEIELRCDIVRLLAARRAFRRSRRVRKTGHRAARFNNRVKSKKKGWLPPSVLQKIRTQFQCIRKVLEILPVTKIRVETASFDIQKLQNPDISGIAYQQGPQKDSGNVRAYVLYRDNHECQCCHGKSGDKRLEVHHIESRQTGGNSPGNLITLCRTCHDGVTNNEIKLNAKRGKSYRDATQAGIAGKALIKMLREEYPDIQVEETYGYITKQLRQAHNLPKTHMTDARCITGNPQAKPLQKVYYIKATRRHNRQLHRANPSKGGVRRTNQSPKYVHGFQLYDKVLYNGEVCFVFSRRLSGYFVIKKLDGTVLSPGISYKKLKLLEKRKTLLAEERYRDLSTEKTFYKSKDKLIACK